MMCTMRLPYRRILGASREDHSMDCTASGEIGRIDAACWSVAVIVNRKLRLRVFRLMKKLLESARRDAWVMIDGPEALSSGSLAIRLWSTPGAVGSRSRRSSSTDDPTLVVPASARSGQLMAPHCTSTSR